MDGTVVYKVLRELDPLLPVIFATGHGDQQAICDGMADPHTRFLQKPFDIDTLLEMIAGVLKPGGSSP
jgi:DNA-binding NtrC family response regulator